MTAPVCVVTGPSLVYVDTPFVLHVSASNLRIGNDGTVPSLAVLFPFAYTVSGGPLDTSSYGANTFVSLDGTLTLDFTITPTSGGVGAQTFNFDVFSPTFDSLHVEHDAEVSADAPPRGVLKVGAGIRKPPSQRNAEYTLSRQDRAIKAMAPGSMAGRVTNAAPTVSNVTQKTSSGVDLGRPEIVFTTGETPVVSASSAPYRVAGHSMNVVQISATLGTAGSSATTVTVQLNGTTFATTTIASGATKGNTDIVYALPVGGIVTAVATAVGTGAQYLTVQVRAG